MAAAILKAMSKIAAIVPSFALQNTPISHVTIGDKIVKTMGQSRRTKQSVPLLPPPPSRPFIVRVFLSAGSSNSGTTLHGGGMGGKDLFPSFNDDVSWEIIIYLFTIIIFLTKRYIDGGRHLKSNVQDGGDGIIVCTAK